ncbi:Glu/Leu/Phe/Val dehydrogenase [Sphingomonas sp. ac-8]|uniref:Glu/Leu/Phe/Val family dehydrogenase n=1 Tax=Sphingomonas sp. ac-8 TaxID=3242977 RepID=UPI003A7F8F50
MNDLMPPETVVRLDDPHSGLRGFIVLHSTALGPAAGGCRLWRYADEAAASEDALRLAAGMTMKNALAGLPLGGGKAVLMLPDAPFSRTRLFEAFGRAVAALDGRYVTAEDVGTGVDDMATVAERTAHVAGLPRRDDRPGDPSPWTARGVFQAMAVAVERRLGCRLSEVTVAVQGVGHVGMALCELLHEAGARLVIAEPRSELAARAATRFGADLVSSRAITSVPADVFAPCALGGVLTLASVATLKARVVCGAANNQLASPEVADLLARRGVLYAPDVVVNAGGIINVAAEYLGWPQETVPARVDAVAARLREVLDRAEACAVPPAHAAPMLARDVVAQSSRAGAAKAALAA